MGDDAFVWVSSVFGQLDLQISRTIQHGISPVHDGTIFASVLLVPVLHKNSYGRGWGPGCGNLIDHDGSHARSGSG